MDVSQRTLAQSPVQRNLFGVHNGNDLTLELQSELASLRASQTMKWNFNFQTEKPLQGKFDWKEPSGPVNEHSQATGGASELHVKRDSASLLTRNGMVPISTRLIHLLLSLEINSYA